VGTRGLRARGAGTAGATDVAIAVASRRATALVAAMTALYAVAFSYLSVARHRAFVTGRFDLGNMVQAVWSTAHGHLLETTDVTGREFSRLGAHVDPVLVLFTPLWWLWSSPEMLLVAQAVIVALGALPAYWLGRRWLGDERLAAAGAAAYLLYPPLQYATLFDFHPVTLAAPLLLYCIWAAEEARWTLLAVFGALACLTQEQVGLALVGLAVWLWARHPARRRAAVIMASAALAWVVVALAVIMPHFAAKDGANPHLRRYEALGSGWGGILHNLVTRPWELVETVATPGRLAYVAALLVPLLLLPVLAPLLLVGAVPQVLINLLADTGPAQTIRFHYAAALTPFLIAAAIMGLARLQRWRRPRALVRVLARPGLSAAILVAALILSGIRLGPLPWGAVPLSAAESPHNAFLVTDHARALRRAVSLVPADAPVSASNSPGAHLSARRYIYLFPKIGRAEWIVVDKPSRALRTAEGRRTLKPQETVRRIGRLLNDPHWILLSEDDGVRVFRRAHAGGGALG
jgi:uncharacterized membrane protein